MQVDCIHTSDLKSIAISLTRCWKGALWIKRLVVFWYLWISWKETVPGWYRWGFLTLPLIGNALHVAIVARCLQGAFPPVDFHADCLVWAMIAYYFLMWLLINNNAHDDSKDDDGKDNNGEDNKTKRMTTMRMRMMGTATAMGTVMAMGLRWWLLLWCICLCAELALLQSKSILIPTFPLEKLNARNNSPLYISRQKDIYWPSSIIM